MTVTVRTPNTSSRPRSVAPFRGRALAFAIHWLSPSAVLISGSGEVDAANAATFSEQIYRRAANSLHLVIDLQGLDFFGIEGFSRLQEINERCAHAGIRWVLVGGRHVSRVLAICDPDGILPTAPTLDAALNAMALAPTHPRLTIANPA